MITTDNLRVDCIATRDMFNRKIIRLESARGLYSIGNDPTKAKAAWLRKLKVWRNEIEDLLSSFPAQD